MAHAIELKELFNRETNQNTYGNLFTQNTNSDLSLNYYDSKYNDLYSDSYYEDLYTTKLIEFKNTNNKNILEEEVKITTQNFKMNDKPMVINKSNKNGTNISEKYNKNEYNNIEEQEIINYINLPNKMNHEVLPNEVFCIKANDIKCITHYPFVYEFGLKSKFYK